jgi:hypothetical protein
MYYYMCVFVSQAASSLHALLACYCMCPHSTMYVPSYYYISLRVYPHTSICDPITVYYYICILILLYVSS